MLNSSQLVEHLATQLYNYTDDGKYHLAHGCKVPSPVDFVESREVKLLVNLLLLLREERAEVALCTFNVISSACEDVTTTVQQIKRLTKGLTEAQTHEIHNLIESCWTELRKHA